MKNTILLLATFLLFSFSSTSQGKYAGTLKSLIGKTYTDSRNIAGLEGWEYSEGSLITPVDDPEMITSSVFQKGANWIVFFSVMDDTASGVFTIVDLVQVRNVPKGWRIRTAFCRQNQVENVELVALVKWVPEAEFLKPAKQAWRFNRDKRRFEVKSVKGIDCANEG